MNATLHLGAGTMAGPLTVFPIWTDAPVARRRPYATTLADGGAVTEAAGGPSVGGVTVTNPGPRPLLLFEGTVLDGGWQHRAIVHDVLVPAGVPLDVPVACVEQGRWHGSTTQRTSRRQVPLAVRGALRGIRREVAAGTRSTGVDQGDVWRRVSRYERVYGGSATSSLVDVQDRAAREVDALVVGLRPLYGQRGVLVGVAGHPVLLEVFDHPRTLAEQWDAIVRAVALDAVGVPEIPTPGYRARAFVQRVHRLVESDGLFMVEAAGLERRDDLVDVRMLALRGVDLHLAAVNVRHELLLAA